MDQLFPAGQLARPLDTDGFSAEQLSALAKDPPALAAAVRRQAATTDNPVDEESFVVVGDLLREAVAPADLRAALFKVAAGIQGVTLVGDTTDPTGRPGVSLAYTYNGVRSELIFDRRSSLLLGERQTLVALVADIHFPVGTVIGSVSYLESGIVPTTNSRP
jgi:RNA polymerase sigma-70 factor (ECF subfamily)